MGKTKKIDILSEVSKEEKERVMELIYSSSLENHPSGIEQRGNLNRLMGTNNDYF